MKLRVMSIIAIFIAVGLLATTTASACYCCTPYGLTPGYWKNHLNAWPISTSTTFNQIGINNDDTLLNALKYQGYGDPQRILLRQAAAAYLNSIEFNDGLCYPIGPCCVIWYTNDALANPQSQLCVKNMFEEYNELGG